MLAINPPIALDAATGHAIATRRIAGIDVADLATDAAFALIAARLDGRVFTRLAFLNAHCANLARDRNDYRRTLESFLVLPDGVGIDLAAKLLYGAPFKANLNGTDFVPHLLSRLAPKRVALIGAAPGIVEAAAGRFTEQAPQHVFLPVSHGFFGEGAETEEVLRRLAEARPDIVLVALGVPAQEHFIETHLGPEHARLAIGVGALLDFMAGRVARAPALVRLLRTEWVWRFALEPRRLFRRYVVGNPRFLADVLKDRFLRGRRG